MKIAGRIAAAFTISVAVLFAGVVGVRAQVTGPGVGSGTGSATGTGTGTQAGGQGQTVVISGHAQTITKELKGGNVRITGDANTVTIKGKIHSLHVAGDENGVRVENVKLISTKGDGNLVKWKSSSPKPSPTIANTGDHNTIEKDDGGSLTPPTNSAMNKSTAAKTGQ